MNLFLVLITMLFAEEPANQEPTAQVGNELSMLDHVITATSENLEDQKKLKKLVVQYLQLQHKYMDNTHDERLSFRMVRKAYAVNLQIKKLHLQQAFRQDFLDELAFFAKIAERHKTEKHEADLS